jgi:transposase
VCTKPAKRNRGALPAHLPQIEVVVDVEDKARPCCGGTTHGIGEDLAEMLDYAPAQLRVKVIRRPRRGCRACEGAGVQAPAPDRPIDSGMATEALLAQILISKYVSGSPTNSAASRCFHPRQDSPLRVEPLEWIGDVSRSWPGGTGHQHRRARY